MSQHTSIDKVTASLAASLSTARVLAEAESRTGSIAALGLIVAVEAALTDLAAIKMDALLTELAALPPVAGGGHDDDHEEISADFLRDPMSWPDDSDLIYFNPPHPFDYVDASEWPNWTDLDRFELTPVEVLAAGWGSCERSAQDWEDLYAAAYPDLVSDLDMVAMHGTC